MRTDYLLSDVSLHAETCRAIVAGMRGTRPGSRQHLDYVDRAITLLLGPEVEDQGGAIIVYGEEFDEE